jgi:hypothetical protein
MNADASTPNPETGDTWEDLDPRKKGRKIKILSIEDGTARCKNINGDGPTTRIRLDRFKPSKGKNGAVGNKGYLFIRRAGGRLGFASKPPEPIKQPGSSVVQMQHVVVKPLGHDGHDGVLRDALNELHPGIDLD